MLKRCLFHAVKCRKENWYIILSQLRQAGRGEKNKREERSIGSPADRSNSQRSPSTVSSRVLENIRFLALPREHRSFYCCWYCISSAMVHTCIPVKNCLYTAPLPVWSIAQLVVVTLYPTKYFTISESLINRSTFLNELKFADEQIVKCTFGYAQKLRRSNISVIPAYTLSSNLSIARASEEEEEQCLCLLCLVLYTPVQEKKWLSTFFSAPCFEMVALQPWLPLAQCVLKSTAFAV